MTRLLTIVSLLLATTIVANASGSVDNTIEMDNCTTVNNCNGDCRKMYTLKASGTCQNIAAGPHSINYIATCNATAFSVQRYDDKECKVYNATRSGSGPATNGVGCFHRYRFRCSDTGAQTTTSSPSSSVYVNSWTGVVGTMIVGLAAVLVA